MAQTSPVIDTYMPAFITPYCNIYFNISDYMAAMNVDISTYSITNLSMQVTISDQRNNKSVLNEDELYPCGIMTKKIYIPPQGSEEFNAGKYYITINSTDLDGGIF